MKQFALGFFFALFWIIMCANVRDWLEQPTPYIRSDAEIEFMNAVWIAQMNHEYAP